MAVWTCLSKPFIKLSSRELILRICLKMLIVLASLSVFYTQCFGLFHVSVSLGPVLLNGTGDLGAGKQQVVGLLEIADFVLKHHAGNLELLFISLTMRHFAFLLSNRSRRC